MTKKTLKKAKWFWEDYVGIKWKNLKVANTGEGLGAYAYVQGKNSKSYYRPKSLFYHYQVNGIDSNTQKLDKVEFVLVLRKFKENENTLPSIKVFYGDNNAPYRKTPIKTVTAYTKRKNLLEYDKYTLAYDITGVSIAQLKNIIIEVDWKKTKVSSKSTISVNRGRLEVTYSKKNPKWGLYESVDKTTATTDEKVAWKLVAKNTGYTGSNTVTLNLPKNVSVVSSTGDGSYNSSTKVWSINNVAKGKSATRTFYIKSNSVGMKQLKATNNSTYRTNANVTREINFTKYDPPTPPVRTDEVTFTFYDTFEREEYQYFDIKINGFKENHSSSDRACYTLSTSENITLYNPIYDNAELIEDNVNVVRIYHRQLDNTLCLVINTGEDFVANVRLYMYCSDDTDGTITINDGTNNFVGTFDILPMRGSKFLIEESISRDKTYVPNSVNIGSPTVWTVNSKAHRHNFFDERKDLMEIEVEKEIAYIGVIPLSRCHKADVTATSKNTLIENRYLNRAYYGKKGDYSEDIKMTLRLAWYDVATLQGLCEMDKPIPIDTIPSRADGDPLNHRGWAEIYEVANIKKINDRLYECDVGVTYLTHDILTRFTISEAKAITEANIKYYLEMIHDYNGDILDLFQLNYYEFWTTLEDANGDKTGSYSIEPNTSLKLTRDLNKYSTYDIIWRNSLPQLMSEDYDGNWEMALKVRNKTTRDVLFEHNYSNYQHYDFEREYAVNTADADTKYLVGGNYETLNHEKISLGYDGLSPLIENYKIPTHFNTMENIVIDDPSEQFEIFLLDKENVGVGNQIVRVNVKGEDGFADTFNVITDTYGRILFDVSWGNGTYNIELTFDENDTYKGCTYNTDVTLSFDFIEYHFTYPTTTPTYIGQGNSYICNILDSSDNGVSGVTVHYSWKSVDGEYGYEETATSGSGGKIEIPIVQPNGSRVLRVNFKGYTSGNNIYQPCQFEDTINVLNDGVDVIIEADNVTLMQGDGEKLYSVILKDKESGTVLPNQNVRFAFYNSDETFVLSQSTNDYGVASVPLYLKGGAYKVDVLFDGTSYWNPCVVTRDVIVDNFKQIGTYVVCEDVQLNEDELLSGEQDYFSFKLLDEYDNAVSREPVNVKIYNNTETTLYIDTVFSTRADGSVTVPFVSHSENVVVQINYKGSVQYTASSNSCIISFETVINKTEQTLSQVTEQIIEWGTGIEKNQDEIILSIGGTVQRNYESRLAILNSLDNERLTTDDPMIYEFIEEDGYPAISNETLPRGNYKLTIFELGDDTKYSVCRTFTGYWVNSTLIRLASWELFQGIEEGGLVTSYEILNDATKVGDYAHIRFNLNMWVTNNSLVTIKSGYVSSDNYSKEYKTTTKETTDENGKKITYFDIYGVLTSEATWHINITDCNPIPSFSDEVEISASSSSKSAITVAQTGFAYQHETYQDLQISLNSNNGNLQYANGFYIIKMFNNETYEELYFYSYIYNNLQPSRITFPLTKSIKESGNNWTMEIFVNHDATHKCGYLTANGRINTDTVIVVQTTSIFVDEEEYTQLGTSITFNSNGFSY